jgi:mannose/fructose/sorbose-specific phosphotransferase system IIB component
MPIVLARIDDRLIHGQIVEGWLKVVQATQIIIVSDEVAKDKMQQALMSMAVPKSVKVYSLSIDDAAARYAKDQFAKDNVLLLFSNPGDVKRLIEKGVKLTSVNVGGMHFSPGKRQILRTLSVDDEDVKNLKAVSGTGIELEGRVIPSDERIDVAEAIKKETPA